jgi:predicted transposase YbfD/YdcC
MTTNLLEHFASLDDPRIDRCKRHRLIDIIAIAICATICGAEGFTDFQDYGLAKEQWLRTFLDLPNGIPSHDTFQRVFARIDPEGFHACFLSWINAISTLSTTHIIAIDGKTARRSHDHANGTHALHLISAWAADSRLVLAQRKVDQHSSELAAIPELLTMLVLDGAIVTIDAAGCQKSIATEITSRGGEYLLALKQNHPTLLADVSELLEQARNARLPGIDVATHESTDAGHGRVEVRRCIAVELGWRWADDWAKLRSIVLIESERHIGESISLEKRYYLTSLPADAKLLNEAVRSHWGIENSVHWVLDIVFREDDSRVRKDHAPQNMAVMRKIALNLLRQETTSKRGIKGKSKNAAWDNDYLLRVLAS